jgi:hypothetical protein
MCNGDAISCGFNSDLASHVRESASRAFATERSPPIACSHPHSPCICAWRQWEFETKLGETWIASMDQVYEDIVPNYRSILRYRQSEAIT